MAKTAIVTGGARGIGEGIVIKLCQMGYNVTINFVSERSVEKAEKIAARMKAEYNVECMPYRANVKDYEACKAMAKATFDRFGSIDVLVNNAGDARAKEFLSLTPEEYTHSIGVDLFGPFNTCHTVIPYMVKANSGCIVNIASTAAKLGYIQNSDYCAAKAGVCGMTRALALEFAPKNIRVNVVSPGLVMTDLVMKNDDYPDRPDPDKTIPLRRYGQPEDIAGAVAYLIEASYVTGITLDVNGGLLM